MRRRQTMPKQWMIVAAEEALGRVGRLQRGSGVLVLLPLDRKKSRQLRVHARQRDLAIICEAPRTASRVHCQRELTRALLRRVPLILLSPVHETGSHPDWNPLPRMRAAALARLVQRRAVALGGMNARRYAKIAPLGFVGWAGISAFRT